MRRIMEHQWTYNKYVSFLYAWSPTRYWANSKARSILNDLQECVWFQPSPVGGYLDWSWVTHVEACWGRTGCSGPTGPQLKVKRPTPSRRIHRESWVFGMVKGNRSMGIHGDPWGWDQAPPRLLDSELHPVVPSSFDWRRHCHQWFAWSGLALGVKSGGWFGVVLMGIFRTMK